MDDIDLDSVEVEIECPRCGFTNPIWLGQARLRDLIICRGCKCNIQLDDAMNSIRKAKAKLERQFAAIEAEISKINKLFR